MSRRLSQIALSLGASVFLMGLNACALLRTPPQDLTLEQRLRELPSHLKLNLKGKKSELRFNEHLVPYIISDSDEDAAFLLGVVHAHLRGFQLELLRHASQGRLSERVGPFAAQLDHALKSFDFGRASARIEASMPVETRLWMESFVKGLNARWMQEPTPFEFASIGVERELWTLRELITVSRLMAADVNWIVWLQALPHTNSQARWTLDTALARESNSWEMLQKIFLELSRSGSNSWVVASQKSENGAPLMANDPHVGLLYPNLWLLVGLHSPSIQSVGLSLPGIPFVLLGRNPWLAWGGTNMRALSTEFYDVSQLPEAEFSKRESKIKIRAWRDRTVTLRETRFGPVLSDAGLFGKGPAFSVKWMGHEPSDEFTAFYRMNKARSFEEFHSALSTYGVSAQNFLYADVQGNIAHVLALKKPKRREARPEKLLLPAQDKYLWKGVQNATELPYRWNPGENFLVSANDRPVFAPEDLGLVFSPGDRARRVAQLIATTRRPVTLKDMKDWQRDVHSADAARIAPRLVKFLQQAGVDPTHPDFRELKGWNANFDAKSRGALVYAAVEAELLERYSARLLPKDLSSRWIASSYAREVLLRALGANSKSSESSPTLSATDVFEAWNHAQKNDLKTFRNWGEKHPESLNHPFSALPWIGKRYRFAIGPASGSFDTLMKRAHSPRAGLAPTSYGATARHVSDLSDPDANEFVLFGGQDGALGSPAALSQVPLWQNGEMIRLPLSLDLVRKEFALSHEL